MAKVLIAEDCDIMRRIAKQSLEKAGFTVIEATTGVEAVDLSKSEVPNIILLDAEMPEMDGWEACRAIRADSGTANIPILMCTGHDLSEEPETLTEAGANGCITKPYNIIQMIERINEKIQ